MRCEALVGLVLATAPITSAIPLNSSKFFSIVHHRQTDGQSSFILPDLTPTDYPDCEGECITRDSQSCNGTNPAECACTTEYAQYQVGCSQCQLAFGADSSELQTGLDAFLTECYRNGLELGAYSVAPQITTTNGSLVTVEQQTMTTTSGMITATPGTRATITQSGFMISTMEIGLIAGGISALFLISGLLLCFAWRHRARSRGRMAGDATTFPRSATIMVGTDLANPPSITPYRSDNRRPTAATARLPHRIVYRMDSGSSSNSRTSIVSLPANPRPLDRSFLAKGITREELIPPHMAEEKSVLEPDIDRLAERVASVLKKGKQELPPPRYEA